MANRDPSARRDGLQLNATRDSLLLKIPSEAHDVLRSLGAGQRRPASIHAIRLLLLELLWEFQQEHRLTWDRPRLHRMKLLIHFGGTPGKVFAVQNCMTCV